MILCSGLWSVEGINRSSDVMRDAITYEVRSVHDVTTGESTDRA
jgi:hypothetical protein